jgi:DNA uptake protein ComE-like DNA-binding protein
MKNFSFGPLKNWFGYSRRERRSSFILLSLIFLVLVARAIVPEKKMQTGIYKVETAELDKDTLYGGPMTLSKTGAKVIRTKVQAGPVEINTCDSVSLVALPGIGPVLAARIIKFRNLLNGFANVEQIKEVYGLSEETYNKISSRLRCDPSHIRKIDINKAEFRQIVRLPYFDKEEVNAILKYRKQKGRIENTRMLVDSRIITEEKAEIVNPYLKFGD